MSGLFKNGINYTLGNSYISAFESSVLGWVVPPSMTDTNEVNGDKFIQRINRIDMSDFAWIDLYNFSVPVMNYKSLNPKAVTIPNTQKSNIFIDLYKAVAWSDVIGRVKDKIIAASDDTILIHDSRYTSSSDIASFKANLKGHYFYYEMANPIEHSISGNEIAYTLNTSLTDLNRDLLELGNNLAKGKIVQGNYNRDNGVYNPSDANNICTSDRMNLKSTSKITYKTSVKYDGYACYYYDASGNYIGINDEKNIPSNARSFTMAFYKSGGVTPSTAGSIEIYVDLPETIATLDSKIGSYDANTLLKDSYSCYQGGFALSYVKLGYAPKGNYTFSFDITNSWNADTELSLGIADQDKSLFDVVRSFPNGHYEYETYSNGSDVYIMLYSNNTIEITNIKLEMKNIASNVRELNESLTEQGLINEFSNSYQQGYYSGEVIVANNDNVADTKRYDCNGGDLISIKYHGHLGVGIRVCYYDASDVYLTVKEGTDTYIENAPSNAKYFRYFLANGSNFPIETALKTSVYVNNAIDKLEVDLAEKLSFLEYRTLVQGGSITRDINMYHTWLIVMTNYEHEYSKMFFVGHFGAMKISELGAGFGDVTVSNGTVTINCGGTYYYVSIIEF